MWISILQQHKDKEREHGLSCKKKNSNAKGQISSS